MTSWKITPPTARAAANVVSRIRGRTSGNDWQAPGIEDCLLKAADMADEPDLIVAMILAAREPVNRTPAIISHPGPHWRMATIPPDYPKTAPGDRCGVCQQPDGPKHPDDHEWLQPVETPLPPPETRQERVARVKAELARGRERLCRHGGVVCSVCEAGKADPAPLPALEPEPAQAGV